MTLPPVVDRELRVAARRRGTYWTRLIAAALSLALFAGIVGLNALANSPFRSRLGHILFAILSWLSFVFGAAAGVFLTSDCISEEKRDGTLGLLFLTDLRGFDVVLGKLAATSLQAGYGLLAAFPVIGLSFLLGGVTGGEFWRLILVLVNTLFFSLAAGMFVSSISREAQKALNGTVFLCLLFVLIPLLIDWTAANWAPANRVARFSLVSPAWSFLEARSSRLGAFWASLVTVHAIAWLFLALASLLTPKTWQDKPAASTTGRGSRAQRWRFGSPAKRAALRQRWLQENPIRWLAGRDLWLGRFQWIILACVAVILGCLLLGAGGRPIVLGFAFGVNYLLWFLVQLWVAVQACRFFVDTARNGILELLLVTPLQIRQVIQGQWQALERRFVWLVLALLAFQASVGVLQIYEMQKAMTATAAPGAAAIIDISAQQIISLICGVFTSVTGLLATAWFGMWMGLISKRVNVAVTKTFVFVQILPWFVLTFASGVFMFGVAFVRWPHWLPIVFVTLLAVGADIIFILVARRKLSLDLRAAVLRVTGASAGAKYVFETRSSPSAAAPPIIAQ